ncbi:3551_t:CDS:2, partial [Gigaspora margarita]
EKMNYINETNKPVIEKAKYEANKSTKTICTLLSITLIQKSDPRKRRNPGYECCPSTQEFGLRLGKGLFRETLAKVGLG